MPWRETCRMDEKLGFCFGVASGRGADDGALRGVWESAGRRATSGSAGIVRRARAVLRSAPGRRGVTAGRWRLGLRRRLWSCAGRIRSGVPGSFARF